MKKNTTSNSFNFGNWNNWPTWQNWENWQTWQNWQTWRFWNRFSAPENWGSGWDWATASRSAESDHS